MTRMHDPPHPGEILREYLADITVTEAAGISTDMAYRSG
jgi:antitoxin HigA-1